MTKKQIDLVGLMMDFEDGSLSLDGVAKLFSNLIQTGQAWTLQGFYGRTAKELIERGYISADGTINQELVDVYKQAEQEFYPELGNSNEK